MKGGTVQINWHDSKPVLCLDFHHLTGVIATGGADYDIKVKNYDFTLLSLVFLKLVCLICFDYANAGYWF